MKETRVIFFSFSTKTTDRGFEAKRQNHAPGFPCFPSVSRRAHCAKGKGTAFEGGHREPFFNRRALAPQIPANRVCETP